MDRSTEGSLYSRDDCVTLRCDGALLALLPPADIRLLVPEVRRENLERGFVVGIAIAAAFRVITQRILDDKEAANKREHLSERRNGSVDAAPASTGPPTEPPRQLGT